MPAAVVGAVLELALAGWRWAVAAKRGRMKSERDVRPGGSPGRPGRGQLGGKSQVGQDPHDDVSLCDQGDHQTSPPAHRTAQSVHSEHPAQELCPRVLGRAGGGREAAGAGTRARPPGNDLITMCGSWGEDAVIGEVVDLRAWNQGGESLDELEGFEHQAGGSVPPGPAKAEEDVALAREREALTR